MSKRSHGGLLLILLLWGISAVVVAKAPATDELIERGRLVALEADCAACHTDAKAHGAPYAGGLPIVSPLGTIYSTNITPDKTTGIGNWTETQFIAAVREGKAPEHHLYPAMPYTDYARLSDADIHALYAYLTHAIKPVEKSNLPTRLPFPFNIRMAMGAWNVLFNRSPASPDPSPGQSPVERGKYVVDALAHCSTCHTPRNALMASDGARYLQGAEVAGWFAPDLTPSPEGLGGWSQDEIVTYLATGHVKGKAEAGGSMAEAVEASFSRMPRADLLAIAAYLKSLPPSSAAAAPAATRLDDKPEDFWHGRAAEVRREAYRAELNDPVPVQDKNNLAINNGAILYNAACAACHEFGGTGDSEQYYPSLVHNTAVQLAKPNNLVMAILEGIDRRGADQHVLMPAFGSDMTDAQVASVANYVLDSFGNAGTTRVTPDLVGELRRGGSRSLGALRWLIYAIPLLLLAIVACVFLVLRRGYRKKLSDRQR